MGAARLTAPPAYSHEILPPEGSQACRTQNENSVCVHHSPPTHYLGHEASQLTVRQPSFDRSRRRSRKCLSAGRRLCLPSSVRSWFDA